VVLCRVSYKSEGVRSKVCHVTKTTIGKKINMYSRIKSTSYIGQISKKVSLSNIDWLILNLSLSFGFRPQIETSFGAKSISFVVEAFNTTKGHEICVCVQALMNFSCSPRNSLRVNTMILIWVCKAQ